MEVVCGADLRSKACCRTGTHHACSKHVHPCAKPTSSTNSPNPPNHPFPSPLTSLPPQVLVLVLLACPPARHTTPPGPTLYQQQHLPTTHHQSQCKCGSGCWHVLQGPATGRRRRDVGAGRRAPNRDFLEVASTPPPEGYNHHYEHHHHHPLT